MNQQEVANMVGSRNALLDRRQAEKQFAAADFKLSSLFHGCSSAHDATVKYQKEGHEETKSRLAQC
jgi:hypothetical protein